MTIPNLTQLNLVAKDFDASVAFYRRLGLTVTERSAPDMGHRHAEVTLPNGFLLEVDNQELAATYNAGWRGPEGGSRAVVGFTVPTREDVDRLYAELTGSGYRGRQRPYDAFWGARYAVVVDPDGVDVGLMSPIDDRHRRWPPTESPTG
jgi:catechol 2,3-dioxygenase-like lactoylglutathione lyase family enzyme